MPFYLLESVWGDMIKNDKENIMYQSNHTMIAYNQNNNFILRVKEMHAEFHISHPFCVVLTCEYSPRFTEIDNNYLCVEIRADNQPKQFISGIAHCVAHDINKNTCQIEIQPAISKLCQKKRHQIYTYKSCWEVARHLLEQLKAKLDQQMLVDYSGITNHYVRKLSIIQYHESDFVFFHRMLLKCQIRYYFTFDKHQHTMHFYDDQALLPMYQKPLLNFNNYDTHHYDLFPGLNVYTYGKRPQKYLITETKLHITQYHICNQLEYHYAYLTYVPPYCYKTPVLPLIQSAIVVEDATKRKKVYQFNCVRVEFIWDDEDGNPTKHYAYVKVDTSNYKYNWGAIKMPIPGTKVFIKYLKRDINNLIIFDMEHSEHTGMLLKQQQACHFSSDELAEKKPVYQIKRLPPLKVNSG